MSKQTSIQAAIIVVDQSFGVIRYLDSGAAVGVDLAAGVSEALRELGEKKVRLGLVVLQQGDEPVCAPITDASLDAPAWAVRGAPAAWLLRCVAEMGAQASDIVFVSADVTLRAAAYRLGMRVAPHATIAAWIAEGREPCFIRLEAPAQVLTQAKDVLPYAVNKQAHRVVVWAAVPADTIPLLVKTGASVDVLRLDVTLTDPYFFRFDVRPSGAVPKELGGLKIVRSDGNVVLLGVGASELDTLEQLTARQHGALQSLLPSASLLQPLAASWTTARSSFVQQMRTASALPREAPPALVKESSGFAGPTVVGVSYDVSRYSGASPLDATGAIQSRHVRHPHAARAVQALLTDLQGMGYTPFVHTFVYQGIVLSNVIADLPGNGLALLPHHVLEQMHSGFSAPRASRLEFERDLGLGGWVPFWRRDIAMSGFGAELVILACHLDSTAQSSPGYNATTSPAPGADDDASGIACVLAAARELASRRGTLTHTVRFCFFHAEEQGLLGSAAYANHLKSTGAPIKAVICVDMAGYDPGGGRSFEIHAGSTDPAVRDASVVVAQSVAKWAAAVTTLGPAQIYRGTSSATNANRDLYDPAIGRADHASFQQQGFPAVVVSEDFFINQAGEEAPEPNPNYHRFTDTSVNTAYTSDIARAVTSAAEELAS